MYNERSINRNRFPDMKTRRWSHRCPRAVCSTVQLAAHGSGFVVHAVGFCLSTSPACLLGSEITTRYSLLLGGCLKGGSPSSALLGRENEKTCRGGRILQSPSFPFVRPFWLLFPGDCSSSRGLILPGLKAKHCSLPRARAQPCSFQQPLSAPVVLG